MAVNPQFRAISNAHYAQAGLLPRKPGQRRGKDLHASVGLLVFEGALPPGWRVVLLGTGPGYGPGGQVVQYDHLAVHSPQRYVYPAYRRSAPGNHFAICQCLQHVGRQG